MSPKQLPYTAKDLVKLAETAGFTLARQKGSHMIYCHPSGVRLTIPNHGSTPLHPKIIKSVLRDINSLSS